MKKKLLVLHWGYYMLCIPVYSAFFLISTILYMGFGGAEYMAWYLLLVAVPLIVVLLTRFSFLKRYVDPIAAMEVPMVMYVGSIVTQILSWDISFFDAFMRYNKELSADGGKGWLFLLGSFVISLITSFSAARKRGESISFRVLSKFPALNQFQYVE